MRPKYKERIISVLIGLVIIFGIPIVAGDNIAFFFSWFPAIIVMAYLESNDE